MTVKERNFDLSFEGANLPTDSRLAQTQFFPGLGKAERFRDDVEDSYAIPIQRCDPLP